MPELALNGCTPEPLASYLKSLGLFRIVSEQFDPQTTAWWHADTFYVHSSLGMPELLSHLLHDYRPTPIVAPWNGGSGFFPKDQKAAIEVLESSTEPRLADYRATIGRAREILEELEIREKPSKDEKPRILAACRGWFPDTAVAWLDAAYVLTSEDPRYPPLLGTGGNDGRLEFSNNYMQRLIDALALGEQAASTRRGQSRDRQALAQSWLRHSLFGDGDPPLVSAAIGQYYPGGVGGPNATQGFEGQSLVNPWDFVLLMEGALLFAGAVARRLGVDSDDKAAFPFTVNGVGTGYGTSAVVEYGSAASRAEVWVPLWERPAHLSEVRQVLSEGRAQWGRHQARTGVDFARAVISLGVDRGISEFRRYGILQRSGRAFLATPLGRLRVQQRPEAQLMHELDRWLDSFRRTCTGGRNVPASMWAALRSVDEAVLAFAAHGRTKLVDVLVAVGKAERLIATRPRARGARLQPLQGLSEAWYDQCYEDSPEYRIAAALASIYGTGSERGSIQVRPQHGSRSAGSAIPPIRAYLEEVAYTPAGAGDGEYRRPRWIWAPGSRSAVWGSGSLVRNLGKILERRAMEATAARLGVLPLKGARPASLRDVDVFLQGECDDDRIEALFMGLSLITWTSASARPLHGVADALPPNTLSRAYALLKLVSLDRPLRFHPSLAPVSIRPEPVIFRLLRAQRVADACEVARRRLRSSGLVPMVRDPRELSVGVDGDRLLAALLVPIWETRRLASLILRMPDQEETDGPAAQIVSADR